MNKDFGIVYDHPLKPSTPFPYANVCIPVYVCMYICMYVYTHTCAYRNGVNGFSGW